ncbi:unnamed protein product [Prunus armeniaca]
MANIDTSLHSSSIFRWRMLVRPLNNEHDLERTNEIQLDKLMSEFRSGLDALTRFVFERTRPKQVGATMMTGPAYPLHGRL